jgi:transposase-like protein
VRGRTPLILALWRNSDKSISAVAREVGCTPANVHHALTKHGRDRFPTVSFQLPPDCAQMVKKLSADTKIPMSEIVKTAVCDYLRGRQ